MIEITAEIRALIDKAAAGVELAGDEYIDPERCHIVFPTPAPDLLGDEGVRQHFAHILAQQA